MKYLKFYKNFENADASPTSGMGAVTSAQPGSLPGNSGTLGSGDVSFFLKKKRRKKGGPSEVSDLRDLKSVSIKKVSDF